MSAVAEPGGDSSGAAWIPSARLMGACGGSGSRCGYRAPPLSGDPSSPPAPGRCVGLAVALGPGSRSASGRPCGMEVVRLRCCWSGRVAGGGWLLLLRVGAALRSEGGRVPEVVLPAALVFVLLSRLAAVLRRASPGLDAFLERPAAKAAVAAGLLLVTVVFGFAIVGTGRRPRRRGSRR